MKVTVKLFALLAQYLPPHAKENQAELEVEEGASPGVIIDRLNMPRANCHLVLINGNYVPPSQLEQVALKEGDALAIWPPVAGG